MPEETPPLSDNEYASNMAEGMSRGTSAGQRLNNTVNDIGSAAKAAEGDPISIIKLIIKYAPKACACSTLAWSCLLGMLLFFIYMSGATIDSAGAAENGTVTGGADQEFIVTHYCPALSYDPMEGEDCSGSGMSVCRVDNPNSRRLTATELTQYKDAPTGTVVKYKGKVQGTGGMAVPQVKAAGSGKIPVPLIKSGLENQAKVYIPGYNGNQPAYVADHFATSITAPNRVDLSFNECGGPNYKKMVDYWSANKIKTESINVRFNGGTKIMGKIMGTVIRNGEW